MKVVTIKFISIFFGATTLLSIGAIWFGPRVVHYFTQQPQVVQRDQDVASTHEAGVDISTPGDNNDVTTSSSVSANKQHLPKKGGKATPVVNKKFSSMNYPSHPTTAKPVQSTNATDSQPTSATAMQPDDSYSQAPDDAAFWLGDDSDQSATEAGEAKQPEPLLNEMKNVEQQGTGNFENHRQDHVAADVHTEVGGQHEPQVCRESAVIDTQEEPFSVSHDKMDDKPKISARTSDGMCRALIKQSQEITRTFRKQVEQELQSLV